MVRNLYVEQSMGNLNVEVDHNTTIETDGTQTIDLSVLGGGAVGKETFTVFFTDDDAPRLNIDPASVYLTEGESGSFAVKLTEAPSADVTVTLTKDVMNTKNLNINPTSLTFKSGASGTVESWEDAQTVTVTAPDNTTIETDGTQIIDLSVLGGGAVGKETFTVFFTDDDAPRLNIDPTSINLTEGESGSFAVKLTKAPSADVTVTLTKDVMNTKNLNINPTSLTFKSGASGTVESWEDAQTVTVTAPDNTTIETDGTQIIDLSVLGGGAVGKETFTVFFTDDDAPRLNIDPTRQALTEGGSVMFNVKLTKAPNADVTVTLTKDVMNTKNLNINPTSLTFKSGASGTVESWEDAQTVTVTAPDNTTIEPRSLLLVDLSAMGGGADDATGLLEIVFTDDDAPRLNIDPTRQALTEGGSVMFNVKLTKAPNADVTVTLTKDVMNTKNLNINPTSLTFKSGASGTVESWEDAQTVTVTAPDNTTIETDGTQIIDLSVLGGGAVGKETFTVFFTDDDAPRLNIDPTRQALTEGGSVMFNVKLTKAPNADVTVTLTKDVMNTKNLNINPTSLTFKSGASGTVESWEDAQTVTVTAPDNTTIEPRSLLLVDLSAMGGGADDATGLLEIVFTDDDAPRLNIDPTRQALTEGGSVMFNVKLTKAPNADVTVTLTKDVMNTKNLNINPTSLTFKSGASGTVESWEDAQTVTVTAPDNTTIEPRSLLLVDLSAMGGGADDATGLLEIVFTDDDAPRLNIDPTRQALTEGGSVMFNVKLTKAPNADVTVTLTKDVMNTKNLNINPTSLTFKSGASGTVESWEDAQTVTVTAPDNTTIEPRSLLLVDLSAMGGGADDATGLLEIVFTDDDAPRLNIDPTRQALTEGGSVMFNVKLTKAPNADVTVTLTKDVMNTKNLNINPTSLTFKSGASGTVESWEDAQTVTVTAPDNTTIEPRSLLLVDLSAMGGGADDATGLLEIVFTDNDAPGIKVNPPAVPILEGSSKTVDVTLALAPTSDVTVTFSDDGDSDVSWSGATLTNDALTFTSLNWNVAQTVTLMAAQDDDFANDEETVTLTASTGGGYSGETTEITVTVEDNTHGIIVPMAVMVPEGGSMIVEVKLATAPTSYVTVSFSDDGDSDVSWSGRTMSGNLLLFTTENWNAVQAVTLTAAEDDDFTNDTETVTLTTSKSGGYSGETAEITVTVGDNDVGGIGIIVPGTATVTEGSTTTVDVTLAAAPTSDITVTFSDDGDSDVSWSGATLTNDALTFTASNWSTAQAVTLTAGQDDDFANDEEVLTLTASTGGGYAGETAMITVTIDDNTPGIIVPMAVTVSEGMTTTVDVTLATAPPANVTVTFSDDGDSDLTWSGADLSGNDLTFTTENWNAAQTVTLTAAEDDDFANDTETLMLTAVGGGYSGETAEITVTVGDNDVGGTGIIVPGTATVTEGSTTTVDVTLAAAPTSDITVTFSDDGDSDVSWSGATLTNDALTFTASNWSTAQAVTLTAGQDDDFANDEEVLTLTASTGGGYAGETAMITVTIDDNTPGIIVPMAVTVSEGMTTTVDVTLATAPPANVTVTFSDDGDSDLTWSGADLSGNDLTFTTENWNAAQTVTLTAAEDDDFANDTETLMLTAVGGGYSGEMAEITVTIVDDDDPLVTPATVSLSASPNPVDEGKSVTITATLSEVLDTDVTIPLTLTAGTADARDYEASSPVQVEIEAGETIGDYPISIVQDDVAEDDETFMVALGILPSGLAKGDRRLVELTITDDDAAGIEAPSSVSVVEQGEKSFEISLTSEPSDDVTVTMSWPSGTDLTVSPPTRVFTPENWHEGQQVILRAADDTDVMGDQVEVILTASGGDYGGVSAAVLVTITDNDAAGIVIPASVMMEEGSERTLGIALAQMPSDAVTVTFIGHAGTDLSLNGLPLTFTSTNWSQEQTVTLTAAEDDDFENDTETLTLTASGGGYDGVTATVTVTIMDNDAAEIVVAGEVLMDEGDTYSLLVRLSAQPSAFVTVTFSGHAGTDLALDKATLTFTAADWQTPKQVTLTAMEDDDDYADETIGLTLTASGGDYDEVEAMVPVTIMDNDEEAPLSISIHDAQGVENAGRLQLPIILNRPIDQVVTVQYASTDGTAEAGEDYTTSRGIVIFDPGATRGVIEIEVTDDELPEGAETFMVTLSQPRNAIIARETGTGTILDDDGGTAILRVDDALVLEEEGMVQFRVSLSHPQRQLITAAYQTQDGTARAGEDYEASSGVVTLAPGTVEAMIAVPLLKDGLDWQEETFTMHLVSSKHAEIAKAVGVATIQESTTVSEAVLEAYSARFVRTSSAQIVEALGERFRSGADGAACGAADRVEMAQLWYSASEWDPSLGELLSGCRMSASSYSGAFSVWGRGAFRQFNGRTDDALTLSGAVTTGMLGADYRWQRGWLAGVLLAHSRGDGSFEVVEQSGEITAGLTGVYPYVSYTRAGWDIWLSAGAGRGQAEVLELKGDLVSRFGAMGVRGTLMSGGTIGLNYHGDVLVTDAELKDHAVTAEVYRVRAGVEANAKISDGLRPYVEASVRSDGGSAETGIGLEFGGGIRVDYPAWRLKGDVRTQGLVMHTADGFTEWGLSGSLQIGSRSEGLMVRVRPSWGRGRGMSMYGQQTILDVMPLGAAAHRTELELGYGIPWKDGTARSIMGVTQLHRGIMYRLGGKLHPSEWLTFSVFGLAHGRTTVLGDLGVNVQGSLRY